MNHLLMEEEGGIGYVTLNRPKVLNALNSELLSELGDCFEHLKSSSDSGVVILTGSGDKAFAAGADIKELAKSGAVEGKDLSERGQALFSAIEQLGKPVIAAVNGYALGGGCELAMACSFRIGSSKARFGLPEVSLGLIPGYGGTQRLARLVGKGLALEMILSGQMVSAERALNIGLVNQIVEPDELIPTCEGIAKKILNNGPLAIRLALEAVHRGYDLNQGDGENLEAALFGMLAVSQDAKEGTSAFLEKRKPNFKGA